MLVAVRLSPHLGPRASPGRSGPKIASARLAGDRVRFRQKENYGVAHFATISTSNFATHHPTSMKKPHHFARSKIPDDSSQLEKQPAQFAAIRTAHGTSRPLPAVWMYRQPCGFLALECGNSVPSAAEKGLRLRGVDRTPSEARATANPPTATRGLSLGKNAVLTWRRSIKIRWENTYEKQFVQRKRRTAFSC